MGLDTSHGCWHGPYSAFMRWREAVHVALQIQGKVPHEVGTLQDAWAHGVYDDQEEPINVLMNHSDCDGQIPWAQCAPLADALEAVIEALPERAMYDGATPAARRFVAGLRRAHEAGEAVIFG